MSQTYTADCFAGSHEAQTDLQNMENNFAALKSMFSGTGAPSNTVAGMPWMDTTKKVLKYRNTADSAWYGAMHGDVSQKLWVYRNAAMDGWAVDSAVSDKVLALKGGSTYTAGAATAGSWTISGLTDAGHTHGAGTYNASNHTHTLADSGLGNYGLGDAAVASSGSIYSSVGGSGFSQVTTTTGYGSLTSVVGTSASGTGSVSSDASWRAAAAVGTLQYLDL